MKGEDIQMVKYYNDAGYSIREIADVMDLSKSAVHRACRKEHTISEQPEVIGDGCYSTSIETGELLDMAEVDHDSELAIIGRDGQMDRIESGYPDIYYNEKRGTWEIWLNGRRIWRERSLVRLCKVRLSKGRLSESDRKLLEAITTASIEVQEALDIPPM